MFRSFAYRTVSGDERKRGTNSFESIEKPPESNIHIKPYNYNKLDKNGIIKIGETCSYWRCAYRYELLLRVRTNTAEDSKNRFKYYRKKWRRRYC